MHGKNFRKHPQGNFIVNAIDEHVKRACKHVLAGLDRNVWQIARLDVGPTGANGPGRILHQKRVRRNNCPLWPVLSLP
ncbi:hypothetical protein, partial [Pusillimonas sp.]|uniref:hypothetical protein n=1 Tax=Pusillimonas sp. TaxID=3040095 RepID=UPI0037C8297E